jgi:hypothetical protein
VVSYKKQLQAELNFDADLDTLDKAARINARETAVGYLRRSIVLGGQITNPVLTMHTTADGLSRC